MGLADTMMSRDQTWLFFTLGRCLERTDVVARQLATVAFDEVYDSGLVILLRSCGGYEPYLRLSQGVVEPGRVLDFLLRDRLFPRSAFASLTLAEECLDQINAGREGTWDDARGLIGLARAELEYSAPATLARGPRDPPRAPAGLDLGGQRRRSPGAISPRTCPRVAPRWRGSVNRADSWRLRVSHETHSKYDGLAARLVQRAAPYPADRAQQTALEARVVTVPPAPQYSYVDYWGTQVVAFNVDRGHETLSITGTSLVDTQPAGEPADCTWSDVADASTTMSDHLAHHLYTAPDAALCAIARGSPIHPARFRRRGASSTGPRPRSCDTNAA